MAISASDVKLLREKTGAGMMACKNALNETNGNFEEAVDYLRKKGLAAAQKKQSRTAAEGMIVNVVRDGKAVLLEVNCETDFVAKGEDFINFSKQAADYVIDNEVDSVEVLKDKKSEDTNEFTLKCGEKIDLRRLVYRKSSNYFGHYNHGGKIGVLVEAEVDNPSEGVDELLKDLSMHVAAANPTFLNADQIDQDFKNREAKIYTDQLKEQGKPENMIPQIVEGKLKKLATEVCLLEQKFVKNPDISVSKHIEETSKGLGATLKLISFETITLGEGVEKREDNLADEVAKMTGQQ